MAAVDPAYRDVFGLTPAISSESPSPDSSPSLSLDYMPTSSENSSPESSPDLNVTSTPPRRPRSVVASFFSRSSYSSSKKEPKKQKSKLKLRQNSIPEELPVSPPISSFAQDSESTVVSPRSLAIPEDPSFSSGSALTLDDIFPMPPENNPGNMLHQIPTQYQAQQYQQKHQQFQQFQQQYHQQQQQMQRQFLMQQQYMVQQQIQIQKSQQMPQQMKQRQQQKSQQQTPRSPTGATTPAVLNCPQRMSTVPTTSTAQILPPNRIPQRIQNPPHPGNRPKSTSSSISSRGRTASWSTGMSSSCSFDSILSDSPTTSGIQRPRSAQNNGQYQPLLRFESAKPLVYEPGEQFKMLPGKVLELILDELKKFHLQEGSESCSTCWTRDLCAMTLTSRRWSKFARTSLYEDVHIVGNDSPAMKKKYKIFEFPRLALLRRTLSSQQIAVIVKNLKVPALTSFMNKDSYYNTVASVIMACPNFERLVGFYPSYDHSYNRLFHALSTRSKLKQMEWIIVPAAQRQIAQRLQSSKGSTLRNKLTPLNIAPMDLNLTQSEAWLDWHVDWKNLTTLIIHANTGGALTPDYLIAKAIKSLPKLQHLFLSNLSYTAFKDDSLLSLPALKTLSLNRLNGISSRGLMAYFNRPECQSLTRLELRHVNIDTLTPICRLLATCKALRKLVIVQSASPVISNKDIFYLMPYATSESLRFLHWDITAPSDLLHTSPSSSILARSIAANGFPALRYLRTPHDPEGVFQSLCKVYERIDTPVDRFCFQSPYVAAATGVRSPPATPTSAKAMISPTIMNMSGGLPTPVSANDFSPSTTGGICGSSGFKQGSDLASSRKAAQARIENSRRFPRFFAHVIDDRGCLTEKIGLGGFLGELQSSIEYLLTPDEGAADTSGGLLEVSDLLANRDKEVSCVDGCTGRWNMCSSYERGAKEERWHHVERERVVGREL